MQFNEGDEIIRRNHIRNVPINGIIRVAFGDGFRGDLILKDGNFFPDSCAELKCIGKPEQGFFKRGVVELAGRFTNQEGSSLTVYPRYEAHAHLYAMLYERMFDGRRAEIKVLGDLTQRDYHIGLKTGT